MIFEFDEKNKNEQNLNDEKIKEKSFRWLQLESAI